ncbi:MAG TPA: hypothetical protein IAC03_01280 [Candidatus Coprenecus pullistercoris]|nr:hypothetical protein [Candidatus Coprenecus pullistercoris]
MLNQSSKCIHPFVFQNTIIIFAHNLRALIMCKSDEFIKETSAYIYSVLNERVFLSPLEKRLSDTMPIAVVRNFKLYKGELFDRTIIFALTHDGNAISPALLKRTFNLIESRCGSPVILVADNIVSYNIGRLTAQRLNFIIPRRQMFIPSLLIDLKKPRTKGSDIKETMPPIAQCLLLYHLEVASIDGCGAKELMKIFQVSYATVNRSLRWLSKNGLISLEGGKTKEVRFCYFGKELWDKAVPMFVSPVEKTLFSDSVPDESLKCGINALSEYTIINEEDMDMYAVGKTDMQRSDILLDNEYGTFRIEVWKYDPRLLSRTGTVDRLSLYLSLKDNEDDRIQIELDNLINDMKW